jgi:hypothetical protein
MELTLHEWQMSFVRSQSNMMWRMVFFAQHVSYQFKKYEFFVKASNSATQMDLDP